MVSSTPRPHFTPGKDPVPILQEAGWAPGPVWTGGKSLPHRDSIPDRPARSQSLYRLSYPPHNNNNTGYIFHEELIFSQISKRSVPLLLNTKLQHCRFQRSQPLVLIRTCCICYAHGNNVLKIRFKIMLPSIPT